MKFHSCIDIEASGFGPRSYPIEVGVFLANGERYSRLIRPMWNWRHWDTQAESVHGITRDQLAHYGLDVVEVCAELNDLCAGETLYTDAWSHDSRWLTTLFHAGRTVMNFKCRAVEMVLDEYATEHWTELKHEAARQLGLAEHRAINDAFIVQHALVKAELSAAIEPTFNARAKQWLNESRKKVAGWV